MPAYAFNQWNPWHDFDRLHNEMTRLLGSGVNGWQQEPLPVNVWVSDEGAVLTAKLPGVQPNKLDISVLGETLTLRGQREPTQALEGTTQHRQERPAGDFVRSVQLPFRVEADKVLAHYANGVLELNLPRAETDKPRRIAVESR